MCPNWCSNTLSVHGSTADVDKFIEDNKGIEVGTDFGLADGEVRELPLSFNRALPTPDQSKFDGMDYSEHRFDPDYWYNFHVNHWGTKWDLSEDTHMDIYRDEDDTTATVCYAFDTAWAPPEAWLTHVAANYPTLSMKIEYREEGMGFAGILGFHNGVVVESQQWEQTFHADVEQYGEMYG